jgi:predicted LPLAT superfamily acyltransferase
VSLSEINSTTHLAWQAQGERGTRFWLRVITWIALHIGRPVAWFLQYPITLYFFLTSPATRRSSREFLSLALGRRATVFDSYRHHRFFACTILDRVYLLSGNHSCLDVRVHGAQIRKKIAHGSSCMILGSHLGSFEVLRALGARDETFSIRVLMRQEQNPVITEFLDSLDPGMADVVIPIGRPDSMLRARDAVAEGHLIGLLGDRAVSDEKTQHCVFLGKLAAFPTGPAKLARLLNIPIYLAFGIYEGRNRYTIHFELLSDSLEIPPSELVQRFAQRLEHYARRFPNNWFNFYDFWQGS